MLEFVCVAITSLQDFVTAVRLVRTLKRHALLDTTSVRGAVSGAMEGQIAQQAMPWLTLIGAGSIIESLTCHLRHLRPFRHLRRQTVHGRGGMRRVRVRLLLQILLFRVRLLLQGPGPAQAPGPPPEHIFTSPRSQITHLSATKAVVSKAVMVLLWTLQVLFFRRQQPASLSSLHLKVQVLRRWPSPSPRKRFKNG